jgi:hypothetical protein
LREYVPDITAKGEGKFFIPVMDKIAGGIDK